MTIENRIINGGFESGSFPPWLTLNATITSQFSHSGYFSAQLLGGNVNSYLVQFVDAMPNERFEFLASLAKVGTLPSPPLSLSVIYYDSSLTFLGYGLITNIPTDHLPSIEDHTWIEIYETTSPAPLGTTQALVVINKLPLLGSSDILVDDVSLLTSQDIIGPTGATGATGPTGAPNPGFIYRYEIFLDPVNGSDTTGNGGVTNPYQTVSHALSTITDNSETNQYELILAPGRYNDGPVAWKDFVSMKGDDRTDTIITFPINYTSMAIANNFGANFDNIRFQAPLTIDTSASNNINFFINNCRIVDLTFNGGDNAVNANNLFLFVTTLTDITIINGPVHAYTHTAIFNSLTMENPPAGNAASFFELVGGFIQGTITLNGNSLLDIRGCLNNANMVGNIEGGFTPTVATDKSSIVVQSLAPMASPGGTLTGDIILRQVEEHILITTTSQTLTLETFILCDTTSGPITITLPLATEIIGRAIKIKKISSDGNTVVVTTQGGNTIDGSPSQTLLAQYSFIEVESDGIEWYIIGRL